MWRQVREITSDVELISKIGVGLPIAVSALNALTYYWALRLDYVATLLSAVGIAASNVGSVAKNLQELLGSLKLERDLHKQHALLKKYLEIANSAVPPLPPSVIDSNFYYRFLGQVAPMLPVVQQQPLAALPNGVAAQPTAHRTLRGITHYENFATAGYSVSTIIGLIATLVLTYRLVTCNREEDTDSSLPDCYNTVDIILIVIVIVTMLMLTVLHSTIAGDLRRWRTSLEQTQEAFNVYMGTQFEIELTARLDQSRQVLNAATKDYLKPGADQSLAPTALPLHVFAALDALDQLTQARKVTTDGYITELREGFEADQLALQKQHRRELDAKEKHHSQLMHVANFFNKIKSLYGELINLEQVLGAMQTMLTQHKDALAIVTRSAAREQLAQLNTMIQPREEAWQREQQGLQQRQIQLKQRLLTLTNRTIDARIRLISEEMYRELTQIRNALRTRISLV